MKSLLPILLLTIFTACKQTTDTNTIPIAFYNCENLFDTNNDPDVDDDDFTPTGKYHYTQKVYHQKLHNIATVIQSMANGDGPTIMGMAEVENPNVLNDLCSQPELNRKNYKYIITSGPDPRGINVALLYKSDLFTPLSTEKIRVDLSAFGNSKTRDILHVSGILNADTIHIFVNHWPSRLGEEETSIAKRQAAANADKQALEALYKTNPNARVIFMGDFNDNPDDVTITHTLGAVAEKANTSVSSLYNPWINIYKSGEGTEEFRNHWNLFDQIMLSGNMLNQGQHLHYLKAEIYKPDFIVDHYKDHKGQPHRSFVGTHWINGYSDHFPVIMYLGNN